MSRFKSFASILTLVSSLRVLVLLLVASPSIAPAQVLIPVTGRREHVFDATRNILYIATSQGTVERYDVATNTLLTPFTAGGTSLNGIDISLDNKFVYVADGGQYGAQDVIRKFNTSTGALTNLFFDRIIHSSSSEGEAWDLAVTNSGFALVTTDFNGSGGVPRRKLDLATEIFSPIVGYNTTIGQQTKVIRSANGNLVLWIIGNQSPGHILTYDPAKQTFPSNIELPSSLTNLVGAVNRNGTLIAYGSVIAKSSLFTIKTTGLVGGVGFNPAYDVFYGVDINSDKVVAYETNTFTEIARYPIGEDVVSARPFANGVMSFSGDGRLLFLSTPMGVRMINVESSIPEPSSVGIAFIGLFIAVGNRGRRHVG